MREGQAFLIDGSKQKVIIACWEGSRNGSNWEYNFDLTYKKAK